MVIVCCVFTHVLAYNLKRVLNVLGSGALMAAMKA